MEEEKKTEVANKIENENKNEAEKKKGIPLIALVLIVVAIVVVGGIATGAVIIKKNMNKEPMMVNEFKQKMEELDYEVYDVTSQFASYDYVEKVYVAIKGNHKYQIEFYKIANEEKAIYAYNINKSNFEAYKISKYLETNVDFGNHSKYTITTDDKYKVVSRIGNTFIYLDVDKEYKEEVIKVLKDLGY